MKLSILQMNFCSNTAKLIAYINFSGDTCTYGEAYRTSEQAAWNAARGIGIKDSQHCKRLAVDLNLFRNGVYLTDTESYKPYGEYWESLNPLNRWGGRFSKPDGNHFESREHLEGATT